MAVDRTSHETEWWCNRHQTPLWAALTLGGLWCQVGAYGCCGTWARTQEGAADTALIRAVANGDMCARCHGDGELPAHADDEQWGDVCPTCGGAGQATIYQIDLVDIADEIDRLRVERDRRGVDLAKCAGEIGHLTRKTDRLRHLLVSYGDHDVSCNADCGSPCGCGWAEIAAEFGGVA